LNAARLAEDNIKKFGEYNYLNFEGRWFTNVEMIRSANRLGNALKQLGVKKGDRVGTQLTNCPQVIQIFVATMKIGAVVVPLNPSARPEEASYLYEDSGIKVLITGKDYLTRVNQVRGKIPQLEHVILTDEEAPDTLFFDSIIQECPEALETEETDNDDVPVLVYTAGTTGKPKGVMYTHFGLYYSALGTYEMFEQGMGINFTSTYREHDPIAGKYCQKTKSFYGLDRQRVILLSLPLCHSYGIGLMMMEFAAGASIVLLKRWDVVEVLKAVEKYKVTDMEGVPAMWVMMLNYPDADQYNLSSLKYPGCGGAPMPLEVLKGWKKKYKTTINEGWGMTELGAFGATTPFGETPKLGSVGKCMQKACTIKIIDDNNQEVSQGEWGEVVFKGPVVMKGYWNKPGETTKTVKNGWLHTGDIGYLDDEGYLYITDRKKDLIIRGGENIYPTEVEEVLYTHPQVMEAAVIGVPDELYGEEIKAFVALKPGESATEAEIITFCKDRLPTYKTPKSIEFKESLPKSEVGKILRKELRASM